MHHVAHSIPDARPLKQIIFKDLVMELTNIADSY